MTEKEIRVLALRGLCALADDTYRDLRRIEYGITKRLVELGADADDAEQVVGDAIYGMSQPTFEGLQYFNVTKDLIQ